MTITYFQVSKKIVFLFPAIIIAFQKKLYMLIFVWVGIAKASKYGDNCKYVRLFFHLRIIFNDHVYSKNSKIPERVIFGYIAFQEKPNALW